MRWLDYSTAKRREVEGGVVVPKPGQVSSAAAKAIVADAQLEASTAILGRARTYARAGQVVSVTVGPQEFTAKIQGSRVQPYSVALRAVMISGTERTDATCDCPYGCDYGWCKHAAALAYVAAQLLDTDPGIESIWTGSGSGEAAPEAQPELFQVPEGLIARLLLPRPQVDAPAMLTRLTTIAPLPERLGGATAPSAAGDPELVTAGP